MEVNYNIMSKDKFKMENKLYLSGWPDWPELRDFQVPDTCTSHSAKKRNSNFAVLENGRRSAVP